MNVLLTEDNTGVANPNGLCKCGCSEKTELASRTITRFGWKKGEPLEWVKGHQNRWKLKTLDEILGHYFVDEKGCWIWPSLRPDGYPQFTWQGKMYRAHRFMYEHHCGAIPKDRHLHHRCEQPACVNPDHLEAVTPKRHAREHSPITADMVREILSSDESGAVLARRFGVTGEAVWGIRRRARRGEVVLT